MRAAAKGGFFLKRVLIFALALVMVIILAACGDDNKTSDGKIRIIDESAPAHEQLLAEAQNYRVYARQKADVGVMLQSEYTYGLAQASVSSLRYAIDTILWLKGEGESLDDVVGSAPYRNWEEIVAAGLGSPAPAYFEGLLFTIQGMDAEAALCYEKASANPIYAERDFYYLKSLSVEELYALRESVLEEELAIYEEYTPRTALIFARTGAEFSPDYHLAVARAAVADGEREKALQSAVNALLCEPTAPEGYRTAAALALDAGLAEQALEYLNEGLWVFPGDGTLNYLAAAVSLAAGDSGAAEGYLAAAKAASDETLSPYIDALEAQMGG